MFANLQSATESASEAGDNGFVMTSKRWIETTGAVGIVSKQGRYAATYAFRDIAFILMQSRII